MRRALEEAATEPAGPSYVTISSDVTRAVSLSLPSARSAHVSPEVGDPTAGAAALRERLAAAERPLLAVGLGAHSEDAALVRRWVEEWRLPVTVTPKIKGIVDETAPLFGGVIGGMAIDRLMVEGLSRADLIVGLGLDPTEIEGSWHESLPLLWVQDSPWATGVTPDSGLIACRHRALMEELLKQPAPRRWEDPFSSTRDERRRIYEDDRERPGHLLPVAAVRGLAAALPADTIVTTDVGSHKFLFGQFWPSRQPSSFYMSNGLSGMGYGLPAAIGAKLARPDRPVLAALGDGGFSMNSQELETARRIGAPVLVAVLADRSYSMIRIGQRKRGLEPYGVDFDPIDSVLAARSCGVRGCRVESEEELTKSAREALESGETTVIEIPILADDYDAIV